MARWAWVVAYAESGAGARAGRPPAAPPAAPAPSPSPFFAAAVSHFARQPSCHATAAATHLSVRTMSAPV